LSPVSRNSIAVFMIVLVVLLPPMSTLAAKSAASMPFVLLSNIKNNNGIKAINHISSNKLKVSREINGAAARGSGGSSSSRRSNIALIKPTFTAIIKIRFRQNRQSSLLDSR
jgi:hypothetical protein